LAQSGFNAQAFGQHASGAQLLREAVGAAIRAKRVNGRAGFTTSRRSLRR
jgi:hypothetical protein